MSNAREIAMKVIYDVEFNGAYSNMALKKALKTDMQNRIRRLFPILFTASQTEN